MKTNDVILSVVGFVTGALALSDVSNVVTIVTGISTIFIAFVTLIRGIIAVVDILKKHIKGEKTADEASADLEKLCSIFPKGDEKNDLQK